MTETLLSLLKVAVGALIFTVGMGSTLTDLTYLYRRVHRRFGHGFDPLPSVAS